MATNNLLYNYYAVSQPMSQDGGCLIYKSGWRLYRAVAHQQGGGGLSFLSGLGSMIKSGMAATGKALALLAKALKPVAAKVGKN